MSIFEINKCEKNKNNKKKLCICNSLYIKEYKKDYYTIYINVANNILKYV